jgi:16S rRNA (guanine527-N7)-methyltransferase
MVDADRAHCADAIIAARLIFEHSGAQHIFDIGSGNGVPGVVMAAMDPERMFYCVDSNSRKSEAIRHFADRMGLKNIKVYNARIEDLGEGVIECAVSRGFASIGKSLLLSRKALQKNAVYYHMKSSSWSNELREIPTQMFRHWAASDHFDYSLPESDQQMSVVVTKKKS